jgi:hypothetical protein
MTFKELNKIQTTKLEFCLKYGLKGRPPKRRGKSEKNSRQESKMEVRRILDDL